MHTASRQSNTVYILRNTARTSSEKTVQWHTETRGSFTYPCYIRMGCWFADCCCPTHIGHTGDLSWRAYIHTVHCWGHTLSSDCLMHHIGIADTCHITCHINTDTRVTAYNNTSYINFTLLTTVNTICVEIHCKLCGHYWHCIIKLRQLSITTCKEGVFIQALV